VSVKKITELRENGKIGPGDITCVLVHSGGNDKDSLRDISV